MSAAPAAAVFVPSRRSCLLCFTMCRFSLQTSANARHTSAAVWASLGLAVGAANVKGQMVQVCVPMQRPGSSSQRQGRKRYLLPPPQQQVVVGLRVHAAHALTQRKFQHQPPHLHRSTRHALTCSAAAQNMFLVCTVFCMSNGGNMEPTRSMMSKLRCKRQLLLIHHGKQTVQYVKATAAIWSAAM